MSCHDICSQENISRVDCARMDRHMIIFAAFGLFLNFVFQSQQNNAAFLVLLMHYQQAFQRLMSAIRRRRVRLNRHRLRNRPWSWTLPGPAESWSESVSGSTPSPLYISQLGISFSSYTFPRSCCTLVASMLARDGDCLAAISSPLNWCR